MARNDGLRFRNVYMDTWPARSTWQTVVAGDFTGNGRLDLAGLDTTGRWRLAYNQPSGRKFASWGFGQWDATKKWQDVLVTDIDEDGIDDLLGLSSDGQWNLGRTDGLSLQSQLWGQWDGPNAWRDVALTKYL
jgi:hypothetical protein